MPLGQDQFVLHRVLEADKFRHPHLVTVRFQIEPANDVRQVARELPPLNGMAPQLVQRVLCLDPRATARPPPDSTAPAPRRAPRASAQSGSHRRVAVSHACSAVTMSSLPSIAASPIAPATNRMRSNPLALARAFGARHQRLARFDRDHLAAPLRSENQIVENEPEIGFARAKIGQPRRRVARRTSARATAATTARDAALASASAANRRSAPPRASGCARP